MWPLFAPWTKPPALHVADTLPALSPRASRCARAGHRASAVHVMSCGRSQLLVPVATMLGTLSRCLASRARSDVSATVTPQTWQDGCSGTRGRICTPHSQTTLASSPRALPAMPEGGLGAASVPSLGNVRPLSSAMGSTSSTSRCSGRGTANISSGRKSSTPSTSWWISTGRPPSPKSSRSSSGMRTRPRRYRQGMGPWGRAELERGVMAWPAAGLGWESISNPLWDSPIAPLVPGLPPPRYGSMGKPRHGTGPWVSLCPGLCSQGGVTGPHFPGDGDFLLPELFLLLPAGHRTLAMAKKQQRGTKWRKANSPALSRDQSQTHPGRRLLHRLQAKHPGGPVPNSCVSPLEAQLPPRLQCDRRGGQGPPGCPASTWPCAQARLEAMSSRRGCNSPRQAALRGNWQGGEKPPAQLSRTRQLVLGAGGVARGRW